MAGYDIESLPQPVRDAMLWVKQEVEEYYETDMAKLVKSPSDITDSPEPPLFVQEDAEQDYRRGFWHGIGYAIELIEDLKLKGFIRPQEIANIIAHWHNKELFRWKLRAEADVGKDDFKLLSDHIRLKQESWWEIRRRIIKQADGKCRRCGESGRLHVHHIHPVADGGVPIDENLEALCPACHQSL